MRNKGKKIFIISTGFFLLCILILFFSTGMRDVVLDKYIEFRLKKGEASLLAPDDNKIRVYLCGTGSPQVMAKSNQPCTVITAAGKVFVFDAGENAMRAIEACGISVSAVSRVFITHWHSDHFSGLDGLINNSWIGGRKEPFDVYGPEGVEDTVKGFATAYRLDAGYRNNHFVQHRELAYAVPHEVKIPEPGEPIPVYDNSGVRIEAFRVDHYPVEKAVGYLFTYKGKKVFISGDTKITDWYLPALRNTDIVIHEAVNGRLIRRAASVMRKMGKNVEADHAEKILEYHADTLELAKLADKVGVKHLVLTHLTPEPGGVVTRMLFLQGMEDVYHGKLTVGYDKTGIVLDPDVMKR